ncbi:ubiquitin carboxyl-terminal hydrolase 12-like [Neltuma alba]|uniref:ubiquitin carboxyl-terminal hydrolase 12-like n=1 Tax=Neltuma alba TaxID=207710 RepID=UPI0010A498A7|nr:ubiquitin carboxyl-terminal hydrolase 12-like [Prosopis alba]
MAEQTRSEDLRPDVGCVTYMIEQRVINARLERLESSLDGITRAMDSLTRSVDRLLHSQAIEVSSSVTDAHMPANINSGLLPERLINEKEAKEHEKKEEAHLYTIIKVARDEDLAKQIGKDIYFDLVDHDRVKCFSVKKQMTFNHFKEEVAKEFGIPVQFMRFWLWGRRQNHSYRPCRPLRPFEEITFVWQLRKVLKEVHINLFLEVELGLDLRPIAPPEKTKDDILLFFKLYDPLKEELRYVGRLFVKLLGKPSEILMKLNEMAGYGREEEIVLYEEFGHVYQVNSM